MKIRFWKKDSPAWEREYSEIAWLLEQRRDKEAYVV